jgi:hypothetical protein
MRNRPAAFRRGFGAAARAAAGIITVLAINNAAPPPEDSGPAGKHKIQKAALGAT